MTPPKASCCLFGAGGLTSSSSSDESVRSMTGGAGRLALVPPPGREVVAGLSRASLIGVPIGVPMLGATDLFGVAEELFTPPTGVADAISRSSRTSKLSVLVFGAAARGDSATFHSPLDGSIVTCSKSLGVFDKMSKTYLCEGEGQRKHWRPGRNSYSLTHQRPVARTARARYISDTAIVALVLAAGGTRCSRSTFRACTQCLE